MHPSPPTAPRPCSVLLVDDDAAFLGDMRDLLLAYLPGVSVVTAKSGKEALGLLRGQSVDLIISDRNMPGMDGLAFLRAARVQCPDVPRILLTGNTAFHNAVAELEAARVACVIAKPPESSGTIAAIRGILSRCFGGPSSPAWASPA